MYVAIEGCMHGELETVYETIADIESRQNVKVDLLLCCGDFQSVRNLGDLKCMACPDKYKEMGSFYKYYSGQLKSPILTIFIGGNHESSNYLQELPYGGWVAPNIYYMGYAGVVNVNGLRIGGLSGILKGGNYLKGHFEKPPYDEETMRSVYHVRNIDVFRLQQMVGNPPEIILSHDWPNGIVNYGDVSKLLSMKPFLQEDLEKNALGSRPSMELLETLKPNYWFSAHLHVKFPAVVNHKDGSHTKFLALDKCLPKRKFLQVLEIGPELEKGTDLTICHDKTWLAILKSTNHLMSTKSHYNHLPGPNGPERWDFSPTPEELREIDQLDCNVEDSLLESKYLIKQSNFVATAEPFDECSESVKMLSQIVMPEPVKNPQTESFCKVLNIDDPLYVALGGKAKSVSKDRNEKLTVASVSRTDQEPRNRLSLSNMLPAPKEPQIEEGFVVDTTGTLDDGHINEHTNITETDLDINLRKKLKRRNIAIYNDKDEEDSG